MPIRLITRADDAGSFRSANLAIREAVERGTVKNVSLMAPCPAIAHAAEVLRDLPVAFGIHVTLNCEWDAPRWGPVLPAARVPSLVEADGTFTHFPKDLHDRAASVDEMVAEVEAQIVRLRALGFRLSYLDQHMGVGWVRGLGERLTAIAAREGLVDADRLFKGLPPPPGDPAEGSDPHVDGLVAALTAAPDGTWVVLGHPCHDDAETRAAHGAGMAAGTIGRDRDGQRRMFMDGKVRRAFGARGVVAVTYPDAVR